MIFKLFKEMIISWWFDNVRERIMMGNFRWKIWSKRCMSLSVTFEIVFSGGKIITLGTRKRAR